MVRSTQTHPDVPTTTPTPDREAPATMATTTPLEFREYLPVDPDPEITARIVALIEAYEAALGDSDKATEPDEARGYDIECDTLARALSILLDAPGPDWQCDECGADVGRPCTIGCEGVVSAPGPRPDGVRRHWAHIPGVRL